MMTSWRRMLNTIRGNDELIACTLSDDELDVEFDDDYGGVNGAEFTAWSADYVYFPAVYDGAEWVARVRRHPCDEATKHVGGG